MFDRVRRSLPRPRKLPRPSCVSRVPFLFFPFSTGRARLPEACSRFAATRATSRQGATPLPQSHSSRDVHSVPGNSSISFIPSVTTALSRAFVSTEQPPATPLYLLLRARPFGSAIPPPLLAASLPRFRRLPPFSGVVTTPSPTPTYTHGISTTSTRYRVASDTTQQVALPPHHSRPLSLPRVSLAPSRRAVSLSFSLGLLL